MRIVVGLDGLGKGAFVKLERAPTDIDGMNSGRQIKVPETLAGDASERGKALFSLLSKHKPVKTAFTTAFANPAGSAPQPFYFRLGAACADALPWEQLYADGHGFVALDRRWPVGRIAAKPRDVAVRTFVAPLRLVALLSAAGRTGVPELEGLLTTLATPAAQSIGVSLHVISGEKAVLERAGQAAGQGVTVEQMGADADAVARQVTAAKPHILHVLCHGEAVAKVHYLSLATTADFLAGEPSGLVRVSADLLATALKPCDPWLVVLAACESAGASQGPGLAQDLCGSGVPAVIGMRRLVDLSATDRFCAALYPELLRTLDTVLEVGPDAGVQQVDWAEAMTGPRIAVSGHDPTAVDTWSDPLLYVQADPLRVYRGAEEDRFSSLKGQIDTAVAHRATLDEARTAPALLAELNAMIADLRSQMAGLS